MKKTFYLYRSGELIRKDNSLALLQKSGYVFYIPIEQLDSIICFAEISMNKRVLGLLSSYEITIVFFNFYGNYIGRFSPRKYYDGKVLLEQVNCYQNYEERLHISKSMIQGSIKNMLALTKYYRKKGKVLDKQIDNLDFCLQKVNDVNSIDDLLIVEAKSKQYYYSIFDIVLEKECFKFDKRSKNPPLNEINAMLSYGYAILYSHVLSVLDRSSLNPQISFIHSISKSYDSLQYDIADILKPMLVDRIVLRLIRKKQIQTIHFDYKTDGRCYLNSVGTKLFTAVFDENLKSTILVNKKIMSYKNLISREVHSLSNYIKNKSIGYKPFVMKW